jgi:hypothetical protein
MATAGSAQPKIIKDHSESPSGQGLGNIRVTVVKNGNVVATDDYYPFRMQMPGRSYCNPPIIKCFIK